MDRRGEFKSLHDINVLRLGYIRQRTDLKKKHVLDVGCGGGILSESMAAAGACVTGIDMGAAALEACHGNKKEAAKLLGISRDAFYRHIKRIVKRPRNMT